MDGAARARAAVADLPWLFLQELDELLGVLRRHLGIHGIGIGAVADHADVAEILDEIGWLSDARDVHGDGSPARHEQGVTVGTGLRDQPKSERRCGAGPVFHQHGLP